MPTLAELVSMRDKDAIPPVLSPKDYLEEYKGRSIVSGRSVADTQESAAQLVNAMTQRGASTTDAPPSSVGRPSGESTAMTPVGTEESKLAELRSMYKLDQLKQMHEEELAKGGAIKQGHYESTGVGALAGSVIGGVGAGVMTGGNPILTSAGAVAGAAVGEAAEQALAPGKIPLGESVANVGEQSAYALAGEATAGLVRFMKPVRYVQPRPLTPEQMRRKDIFDKHGIPYMPHEITDSGAHKFLADIGEAGVLSKNAYKDFRDQQNDLTKIAISSIADQVGQHVPVDELAPMAVKVIKDSREAANTATDILYNTVRDDLKYTQTTQMVPTGRMMPNPSGLVGAGTQVPEMAPQSVITGGLWSDITATKKAFEVAKADYEAAAKNLHQPDMLQAPWYETVKRATALPEQAQWNDAHLFLKEIRAEIRRVQDAKAAAMDTAKMADLGVLRKTEAILENDLKNALASSPDPLHQRDLYTWDLAQNTVKNSAAQYNNEITYKFTKAVEQHGGEQGMKQFVLSLPPEDFQKVLRATSGDPGVQQAMQRSFIEIGLDRAGGVNPTDTFNPKTARNFLFGKDEFTARKVDMAMPQQVKNDVGEFLNATQERLDAQKTGKTGAVFAVPYGAVQVAQGDVAEGGAELGGSLTILAGPSLVARLLQNHRTAQLLIQGIRYSASQTTVGRVVQQLTRLDEGFARAVQAAVSSTGVLHQPAQQATGSLMSLPTAFPLEK